MMFFVAELIGRVLGSFKFLVVVATKTALSSISLEMWNDVYQIVIEQGIRQSQIKLFFFEIHMLCLWVRAASSLSVEIVTTRIPQR